MNACRLLHMTCGLRARNSSPKAEVLEPDHCSSSWRFQAQPMRAWLRCGMRCASSTASHSASSARLSTAARLRPPRPHSCSARSVHRLAAAASRLGCFCLKSALLQEEFEGKTAGPVPHNTEPAHLRVCWPCGSAGGPRFPQPVPLLRVTRCARPSAAAHAAALRMQCFACAKLSAARRSVSGRQHCCLAAAAECEVGGRGAAASIRHAWNCVAVHRHDRVRTVQCPCLCLLTLCKCILT